jgi:hypothetical protein
VQEEVGARSSSEEAEATRRVGKEEAEVGPAGGWDGESPQSPRECNTAAFSCKTQNLLRLLLEPLQCAPDLHFADADAFTATAGDSLTVVWLAAIVWYQEKLACPTPSERNSGLRDSLYWVS